MSRIENIFSQLKTDNSSIQILTGNGVLDIVQNNKLFLNYFFECYQSNFPSQDIVMVYDPVKCELLFIDEMNNSPKPRMRGELLMPKTNKIEITDVNGVDLIGPILNTKTIKTPDSPLPDRIIFECFERLVNQNKKVTLIVKNANEMFSDHPSRRMNASLLGALALKIFNSESKIILIDDNCSIKNIQPLHSNIIDVGSPSEEEIKVQFKGVKSDQIIQQIVSLRNGLLLKDITKIVSSTKDDSIILELKKLKQERIAKTTSGVVKCTIENCTDEMISISEDEKSFWKKMAATLGKSNLLPQGVLLVGPPGTGKSIRARYLASSMNAPFLELSNISSSGLRGIKEDKIRAAFEAAIAIKPCILFIDEIDKYLPKTESADIVSNDDAEVAAYIQRMLDSKEMNGVIVVGTANNPETMNEALLRNGRFGLRVAVLFPKTVKEKTDIFIAVMNQFDELKNHEIQKDFIQEIVSLSNLNKASGADYKEIIRRALIESTLSNSGFYTCLAKIISNFSVKSSSNISEMESKALEMHNAGFHLMNVNDEISSNLEEAMPYIKIQATIADAIATRNSSDLFLNVMCETISNSMSVENLSEQLKETLPENDSAESIVKNTKDESKSEKYPNWKEALIWGELKHYKDDVYYNIDSTGTKRYWKDDIIHRDDGPAIEWANGNKHWFKEGKFHRLDGPAIEEDRHKAWAIKGKEYTQEEFNKQLYVLKIKEFKKDKKWKKAFNHGNVKHYKDDIFVSKNYDGSKIYWKDGLKHRDDGPAVVKDIWSYGDDEYWVNGTKVSFKDFKKWIKNGDSDVTEHQLFNIPINLSIIDYYVSYSLSQTQIALKCQNGSNSYLINFSLGYNTGNLYWLKQAKECLLLINGQRSYVEIDRIRYPCRAEQV